MFFRCITFLMCFFTLSCCAVASQGYAKTPVKKSRSYSDAHVHNVNFFQQGEGLEVLLQSMDAHNIDHSLVSGMGVNKTWSTAEPRKPRYFLSDSAPLYWYSATDYVLARQYEQLTTGQKKRLHLFISGFNPTDKNAAAHIEQLIKMYPNTWQGIGEVFTRHDDLSALTEGEKPRANHEALFAVYELAEKYDLPVMIHSNITSKRERKPIYLSEFTKALSKYPKTRFIWAHAGTSANIHRWQKHKELHGLLDDLLVTHDNLWIDLSWSVLDTYILDKNKQPRSDWLTLIEKHPERFMIGSDVVGKYRNQGKILKRFDALLDALSERTAVLVARDNFLNVLPDKPAKLALR